MPRVELAPAAMKDLERLTDFLQEQVPEEAEATARLILSALEILERHPFVGRPAEHDYRELVISRGRSGYLALYRYDELKDVVVVLAVRHQRELSYGG